MRMRKYLSYPLALVSLLLTHELTYFILYPNQGLRVEILSSTGHSWLSDLPLLLTSFLLLIVYMTWNDKPELLNKKSLSKITLIQYFSFIILEFGERALSSEKLLPAPKILGLALLISLLSSLIISLFVEKVIAKVIERLRKGSQSDKEVRAKLPSYPQITLNQDRLLGLSPRSPPNTPETLL